MQKEYVDLNFLLNSLSETLEAAIDKKQLVIKYLFTSHEVVKGDPLALQKAFFDIFDNAVRNTSSKGRILIVVSREVPGTALIKINNTGRGVIKEKRRLFFKRSGSQCGDESGPGLFACKEIIEAHNGTIDIQGDQCQGVSVFVRLPCSVSGS